MAHQLSFTEVLSVFQDETGLCLPVTLYFGEGEVAIDAYLDTGAKYSFFPRWVGDKLGLEMAAGTEVTIRTGGGPMEAFLHYLTLQVGSFYFDDAPVCFPKHGDFPRSLIGRAG